MKRFIVLLPLISLLSFAIQLKLALKEGDKFEFSLKNKRIFSMGEGITSIKNSIETEMTFNVAVKGVNSKTIVLNYLLKKAKIVMVTPEGVRTFDTDSKENYSQIPFFAMLVEMKQVPIGYTIRKKDFKIVNVDGYRELLERVIEKTKVKNRNFRELLKKNVENKKEELSSSLLFNTDFFPYFGKELEKGRVFKIKRKFKKMGITINSEIEYTVENITDRVVTLSFKSNYIIPEDKELSSDVYIKAKGWQKGSITIYRDSGLVNFASFTQDMEGFLLKKGSKEKVPLKEISTTIIRYKRVQ